jgi:glycine oxidase
MDVAIVGGGVIGLSLAWSLAGQGRSVAVVEQGDFGRESSWAGAGMLPPGRLKGATTAEARLRAFSAGLWDGWAASLQSETGVDSGYRRCGGLHVAAPGETTGASESTLLHEVREWVREGVEVHERRGEALREIEPALAPAVSDGYLLPTMAQVRNPRLVKALTAGCLKRGVELVSGTPVMGFRRNGERVTGVETASGAIAADRFCVTGGAWSRQILAQVGVGVFVEPVRGQIVLLNAQPCPIRHVIECGPRYLVPRGDGRILVGATEERVGFDRRTTAGGIGGLIDFALSLVPSLSSASIERTWAGFRPGSIDGLPYLGAVPGFNNLFMAAGHHRNGLQMSPGTAVLMQQALTDEQPGIPLEPYSIRRGMSES